MEEQLGKVLHVVAISATRPTPVPDRGGRRTGCWGCGAGGLSDPALPGDQHAGGAGGVMNRKAGSRSSISSSRIRNEAAEQVACVLETAGRRVRRGPGLVRERAHRPRRCAAGIHRSSRSAGKQGGGGAIPAAAMVPGELLQVPPGDPRPGRVGTRVARERRPSSARGHLEPFAWPNPAVAGSMTIRRVIETLMMEVRHRDRRAGGPPEPGSSSPSR